jgi:hypothetical protein
MRYRRGVWCVCADCGFRFENDPRMFAGREMVCGPCGTARRLARLTAGERALWGLDRAPAGQEVGS